MTAQVLIADDERLIRSSLKRAFEGLGLDVEAAGSFEEAERAIAGQRFDLAILDLRLGDGDGIGLVKRLKVETPEAKVVVITAHGSVETAVEAMKLGAFDFVKKPFELDELLTTAQNALKASALERRLAYHDQRERARAGDDAVAGRSPAMQRLDREVRVLATQPVSVVLVAGETGAGKALVARRLHFSSPRADGPFVELNAAAIPETLLESELFGHERGAFSDARQRKLGLVEVADGGTLFLDEIGDLGAAPQAKLLSVIESFTFRRLGATTSRTVDLRVVAATNRDLDQLVKEGKFRADLYYRLSALTLVVPPLRERREDIRPLAEHFLRQHALRFQKRFRRLSDDTANLLAAWRWPGNVRELKAVIQRAVLMNEGEVLEPEHLPSELVAQTLDPVPNAIAAAKDPTAHIATLEEIELEYMRSVLKLTGGNKVRAAERLGITRQTLAKRLGEAE
ncbi:MAG TPA: sigma-54 dependent transcriptional regulator [Polyangia bacterium]